jgi:Rieske Fe-S protein
MQGTDLNSTEIPEEMVVNLFMGERNNVCEVCGNVYDKCFEVRMEGATHVFDSFECAIHALAPRCAHCGCRLIGHGMEANGVFFCCAHCASQAGVHDFEDRLVTERSST